MNAIVSGISAAAQHRSPESFGHSARRMLWVEHPPWPVYVPPPLKRGVLLESKSRELLIKGITQEGRVFRPNDWSERLAGAMSSFRPDGLRARIGAFIGYSPYCMPRTVDGVKCVLVSEALRDIEPLAWDFVTHFARDNLLQVIDVDPLPGAVSA
jgi:hypothetical protein